MNFLPNFYDSMRFYFCRDVTTVKEEIVIAVVSCGMRQQETLNMLKSIIIFGYKSRLRFIVITEDHLMNGFREKLADWANSSNVPFRYDIKPILFPTDNEAEWRNLFKPCASQRLFLPVSCRLHSPVSQIKIITKYNISLLIYVFRTFCRTSIPLYIWTQTHYSYHQ